MRRSTLRISTGTIRRALKKNQQISGRIVDFTCLGQAEIENIHTVDGLYPVRNNGPLLPPGQAPPRKGSCPGGRPSGPAAAVGLDFRIIPSGFNAPLGFEPFDSAHGPKYVEGSQPLEFLTGFIYET
jgi:hypothetical protein